MNLLAHASVGLTGAVSVEVRRVGFDVRDSIDRITYPQESTAAALDCWRRLHEGYALAGEVVTVQHDGESAEAHDARHAAALRHAVLRAQGTRDAARESDRLATATITALARSGAKCSEGYRGDGSYTAVVNGFIRTGVDPARVVLDAAKAAGLDHHAAVVALAQRLAPEVVPLGAGHGGPMLFLDATYGSDTHVCAQCPDGARPSKRLDPATERQASAADGIEAGDLICPTYAAMLTADADAIDAMVLDRETAVAA